MLQDTVRVQTAVHIQESPLKVRLTKSSKCSLLFSSDMAVHIF